MSIWLQNNANEQQYKWHSIMAVYPKQSNSVTVRMEQYLVSPGSMVINKRIPLKEHGHCVRNIHWSSVVFTKDPISSLGKPEFLPLCHYCQQGWEQHKHTDNEPYMAVFLGCQLLSPKWLLVPDTQWHFLSLYLHSFLLAWGQCGPSPYSILNTCHLTLLISV